MRLTWTDTASESVDDIRTYLRGFSEDLAATWIARIHAAAEAALQFPRRHRLVPEIGDDQIREVIVDPYRIWYRIYDAEERIEVLVVFHGSRNVP